MPNICNSAHSCPLNVADGWLAPIGQKLQASPALGDNYLIVITFDEAGLDNSSCFGAPAKAGGRVATRPISPQAKSGYQDNTPLSHYSLLKTIILSWKLPELGYTALSSTQPITAPGSKLYRMRFVETILPEKQNSDLLTNSSVE